MQPGGGCGDRPGPLGVHCLVALGVVRIGRVGDIGRQRDPAAALEQVCRAGVVQAQAVQIVLAPEHLGAHAVAHQELAALARRVAGADQGQNLSLPKQALDEQFDASAATLTPGEPRFDHAGVVQHQHVARPQQARQVGEKQVLERARAPVEVQEAASGALGRGMLRDELFGQRIVELGDAHGAAL